MPLPPLLLRTLSLLIFIHPLAGCGDTHTEYFPMDAGRRWVYDVAVQTMDGGKRQRLVMENLHGGRLADQPVVARRTADGKIALYSAQAEGIFRVGQARGGDLSVALPAPEPVLIMPLVVGTTWQAQGLTVVLERQTPPEQSLTAINVNIKLMHKIAAVDETVQVPAGVFERCIKVEASGKTGLDLGAFLGAADLAIQHTDWYAPGVGLVKSVRKETTTTDLIPHGEYTTELVEHTR